MARDTTTKLQERFPQFCQDFSLDYLISNTPIVCQIHYSLGRMLDQNNLRDGGHILACRSAHPGEEDVIGLSRTHQGKQEAHRWLSSGLCHFSPFILLKFPAPGMVLPSFRWDHLLLGDSLQKSLHSSLLGILNAIKLKQSKDLESNRSCLT